MVRISSAKTPFCQAVTKERIRFMLLESMENVRRFSQSEIRCAGYPTHLIFLDARNESAD